MSARDEPHQGIMYKVGAKHRTYNKCKLTFYTLCWQIEIAQVLLGQVFLGLLVAISTIHVSMSLISRPVVLRASAEKFEIHSLGLSQVCIEKTCPNKTRTVSMWQERVKQPSKNIFPCSLHLKAATMRWDKVTKATTALTKVLDLSNIHSEHRTNESIGPERSFLALSFLIIET